MQIWKAHYKDSLHDIMIEIVNKEEDSRTEPLSFALYGVKYYETS